MNKNDLARAVAAQLQVGQGQAADAVGAVFDAIKAEVAEGREVTITGFGKFGRVWREGREGRNPANGQAVPIPARWAAVFKPGSELRAAVNGQAG